MRTATARSRCASRARRGAVLVEFALVALAFYLLIAATVTFGQLLHTAQVTQDAARLAARELALTELPATMNFDQALADPAVRARVYDPDLLAIDLNNIPGGLDIDSYYATLPVVNQALRPVMIRERVELPGGIVNFLRLPGALVTSATAPSGYTVAIPRVASRNAAGHETIEWVPVLEEIRTDPTDATTGPFSVTSTAVDRGMVAVRINIPYQSAAMGAFQTTGSIYDPNLENSIEADETAVTELNAAPGALVGRFDDMEHTYHGQYGMGSHEMLGKKVRPFRRLVTAQALFRRELFTEQSQP